MDYVTSWWNGTSTNENEQENKEEDSSSSSNAGGVTETILLNATIEQAMQVITDYEYYSEFLEGCNRTEVVSKSEDGKVQDVFWNVSVSFKTVEYVLRLTMDEDGKGISWTAVEDKAGPFVKNVGGWKLRETDTPGVIEATYSVDIELNVWVPEFLKNWVLSAGLPATLSSFKNRIESLAKEEQ